MSACLNACGSSPAAREALKIAVSLKGMVPTLRKDFAPSVQIQEKTGRADVSPVRVHWCNGSQSLQSGQGRQDGSGH